MSHLDDGMIHALLDGEIPSAELPPIQAHLGACAECRARLAEEQELLETSDRLIDLIEVPAAFYVGLWFVIQLFSGVGSMAPETAHGTLVLWPNVVGFVAGALCGLYSRFRTASLREYWR